MQAMHDAVPLLNLSSRLAVHPGNLFTGLAGLGLENSSNHSKGIRLVSNLAGGPRVVLGRKKTTLQE